MFNFFGAHPLSGWFFVSVASSLNCLKVLKERDYNLLVVIPEFLTGAEEETRTLTPVRELDPEPSVSTNFTTSAAGIFLDDLACFGKCFFLLTNKSWFNIILQIRRYI